MPLRALFRSVQAGSLFPATSWHIDRGTVEHEHDVERLDAAR